VVKTEKLYLAAWRFDLRGSESQECPKSTWACDLCSTFSPAQGVKKARGFPRAFITGKLVMRSNQSQRE